MTEPYLIRKRGAWYRPNCSGYTNHVRDAGVYDEAFARKEASIEPKNMEAIPLREYLPMLLREKAEIVAKLATLGEDPTEADVEAGAIRLANYTMRPGDLVASDWPPSYGNAAKASARNRAGAVLGRLLIPSHARLRLAASDSEGKYQ